MSRTGSRIAKILNRLGISQAIDWMDVGHEYPTHALAYAADGNGRQHCHDYSPGHHRTRMHDGHRHPLIYDSDGTLLRVGPAEDRDGNPLPDGHSHAGPVEDRERWLVLNPPDRTQ